MTMSLLSQLLDVLVPRFTKPLIKFIMSQLLTKLASEELTEELRGISDITGCPVWALIAYNIGYDLMAGCTSGGMMTKGENGQEEMFHYRNLDWYIEETRQTTIKVVYTRNGKSVLEAIHYFGMVGTHTGVRQGLSCSLNFRAMTNQSTSTYTALRQAFGTAIGRRRDATCMLREILTSPIPKTLDSTIEQLEHHDAAPAYLILCSPDTTAILEKDYTSAKVATSTEFLACTNHDNELEDWADREFEKWAELTKDTLLSSTIERKHTAEDASQHVNNIEDLKKLTQTWPVLNSLTTFGVIMSPARGTIDWTAWYKEPPIPPKRMENWREQFTAEC